MARALLILTCCCLVLLIPQVSSVSSYHYPARIVSGIYTDVVAVLMKHIWSWLTATSKPAVSSVPVPILNFESGYNVETMFDGTKHGVEPYTVEMLPSGDLLVLDSTSSNLFKISSPASLYSRPKLIAGSAEGDSGHVDGKLRDAKLNHPMGIAVDLKGNIYVADSDNMVIRKITETGVTTIAGGKRGRSGVHKDGPSEDAKFSSDFDLVYVGSSCSLLVVDRGNKAIREIQLHLDDCTSQNGSDLPLGIVILVASCFFGYMLALLHDRVRTLFSSHRAKFPTSPHQTHIIKSVRPPLIPTDDTVEKTEQRSFNNWPPQESFMIRPEDEPPSIDFRTPHSGKMQGIRRDRVVYHQALESGQQYQHRHQYHHHHKFAPQMFTDQSSDNTDEFEFGAVQEQVAKRKKHYRNQLC